MGIGRALVCLYLALAAFACAQSAPERAPETTESERDTAAIPDDVADEQSVRTQYEEVLFRRHLTLARRRRDAMELERALEEAEKALDFRPTDEEAIRLRSEIQRMLGDRAGETRTFVEDQYEAFQAKRQEQKVTVRREIAAGRKAAEAGDFDAARRAFGRATFIVSSAKLSPLGTDDELAALGAEAERGKRDLERRIAVAQAEQERRDTESALRRVAEIEEQQLLEARDRRARILGAAIDRFNHEEFEAAEELAAQVLAEEPDNTVARDIVENARRARHTTVNARYLRELKESFRRWQVEIEQTKVPFGGVLRWPSQRFWDRITQLRARKAEEGGPRETPQERKVENTLRSRIIDLPFENVAFADAVEYLAAAGGVNFVIDPRAREDLDAVEITLDIDRVPLRDALQLILAQASAEGEIVYEVVGNVVRFVKREHVKKPRVLRIHPVADLTMGLTDFIPPQITLLGPDEDEEVPLFGAQAEEAPQPYGTIEELIELVRSAISPATWEEGGQINAQGKNLVVHAPVEVQDEIARFLDDLRAFAGIVVTIESRFLTVTDAFLRDLGVDLRGLGGTNGGPLAVLDDVTSGLVNNTSAGFDNAGPGVDAGGAALPPSSGLYFSDGADGDFRGRIENILTDPLGGVLTALGGATFQVTYIDDLAVSAIIRATEKTANLRELTAPSLTVYNTQRAHLSTVTQISFIQDFDVEVAQTAFIADPVIGVLQEGLVLDVRPTVSNDRHFITLELRPTITRLTTPIQTFQTLLGAAAAGPGITFLFTPSQNPVIIQLPEMQLHSSQSTIRVPDGGSVLMGGLKQIKHQDLRSTTPILGNLPLFGFLFQRRGKSEEVEHVMIIVTATITDLQAEAEQRRG